MVINTINELFNKINKEIKEYGYCCFSMTLSSFQFSRYLYDISVSYNKNFSNNIKFVFDNINHDTIEKDLSTIKAIKKQIEVY